LKTLRLFIFLLCMLELTSCNYNKIDKEEIKAEIMEVEKSFQKSLMTKGVSKAFYEFAAEGAVIKRENDTLIIGKESIKKYYSNLVYNHAVAEWKPDFVDVSEDGSMAYTYGKYAWTFIDASCKKSLYKGVFHTVWRKTDAEGWKYVWD
jgi:ketosteroid isomerase-like protein